MESKSVPCWRFEWNEIKRKEIEGNDGKQTVLSHVDCWSQESDWK